MKTIAITGIIGYDFTAEDFKNFISSESREKIRIVINSPGGLVSHGFDIYNMIEAYKGEVEIILGREVSSIASYIAMAVPMENRKAFSNSSMMWHETSGGLIVGRARDLKTYAERLEGLNNIIAEAYAKGTKKEKEETRALMQEDYFVTGWEQLTDKGIINDIIEPGEVNYKELVGGDLIEETIAMETAKARMYEVEASVLKDSEKSHRDLEKAAAYLKQDSTPLNKGGENNIEEDTRMSFKDHLNSNPEHKAEFEAEIKAAEERGMESAKSASDAIAERQRIASIVEAAGIEVTETMAHAIDEGLNAEQYALAELKAQKEKRVTAQKKNIFGGLVAKQTPQEHDPAGAVEAVKGNSEEEMAAFEKRLEEARAAKKEGRVM